jgi:anti-sigma B factor antagonist
LYFSHLRATLSSITGLVEVYMALDIKVRPRLNVTVVECVGRLVFGEETTALRNTVKPLLSNSPNLVLNLAGVRDIDSSGIGTLVGLFASAMANNGELKLACLCPKVKESLRITRILRLFRVYEREDEAIAAFGGGQERTAAAS